MADPSATPTLAPTRRRRTLGWVVGTIVVITALQVGPSLCIVAHDDLSGQFDWLGYTIYQSGSLVLPLVLGCIGLLFRRNPGFGYCLVATVIFVLATIGDLAP